jgi:class 3 adenylate cyclase/predicted ATPase
LKAISTQMQCPQCRAENREGSRFCAECGAPLASVCPDCGFTNYPNAKFCGGCGKTLSASSVAESGRKRETSEPERRQLTVMFCDLVGSTALAERLDPEDLHQLLAQYQDACADVIDRYEGHIARYVGDGLLVYFGYPKAHEDDPQRAVRAGLGIVEAIENLDAKCTNPSVDLAVRIGITTGLVVAGDIGSGERREEDAIVGETPNLAARLQAMAEPNTVLIGASTQRLVEGLFECDDLGAQNLKGISQAVKVYRVRAEGEAASRFEAAAQRGLTPLVGRESELGLLLNRWAHAKEGEGQAVLFSGEAGIGKSRIVRAFRDHLDAEPHSRVLYYGSPYHQNSAFYPAIEQLERDLRFGKEDGVTQRLDKLEAVLRNLDLSVDDLVPLLAALLSLKSDGRFSPLTLAPEELKRKTLAALVGVYEAMALQRPVLMVIEDVHWIDPSTRELITLLIERLASCRIFLLITCRPEFESPWAGHTHITSFTLNRLSRKESASMIARVTQGKGLPEAVLDEIVVKTDGVPLFLEELTKTVLESGLLENAGDRYILSGPLPALAIPTSLQDSLMARLDRLASGKEIAQLGAVIGREFSYQLLAGVSRLADEELHDALRELNQSELIFSRGSPPDATYNFKHALVQDVAYQSLLKNKRQQYHQRIAEVLEERLPEIANTEPELLAHHYTEAQLAEPAIDYWYRAGQLARERSANVEAIAHLTKGLGLLESIPDTTKRAAKELALQMALGLAYLAAKGFGAMEVERTYARARELCEQVGDTRQLFKASWGLGRFYTLSGQLRAARQQAEEILVLAQRLQEPEFLIEGHLAMGITLYWMGEFAHARSHNEQVLALYNPDKHGALGFEYGEHPDVTCWARQAFPLWMLGYPDRALESSRKAIARAQELSHPFGLARALNFVSGIHQLRREPQSAQKQAEAAISLATEKGFAMWMRFGMLFRGCALIEQGQTKEGIAQLQEGIAATSGTGLLGNTRLLGVLADAFAKIGKPEKAFSALAEAAAVGDKTGEDFWQAELHRLRGELLLRDHGTEVEAESCFQQALEIARNQSTKSLELRAATSLARLWQNQGKRQEAHDLLTPIYSWFTEGFDTADLKEAKALLGELV